MEVQVQSAIEIAWNPRSEQSLKSQAFDFLNQLRSNPGAGQICLSLFKQSPRLDEIVRHVCLEIVNNAIQSAQLSQTELIQIRDGIINYIREVFGNPTSHVKDTPTIQNKIAQTLTYLFEALYSTEWKTFFDDLLQLANLEGGQDSNVKEPILMYLRVLASVHDEIADQLIHASAERQKLFTELKDLVRVQDAAKIAASWQTILSRWRTNDQSITELCLKTISRWVSWTEISLIVNETLLNDLYEIASQQDISGASSVRSRVRDGAIDVFTEIVGKKMKPDEKIELIRFLNLERVVQSLVSAPALEASRGTPAYDTDMAEAIAKLVNNVLDDIIKVLDSGAAQESTKQHAEQLLQSFVPYLLRFFSDEYDEVCSTVVPALNDLLTLFRKFAKSHGALVSPYNNMLPPILDAIIAKTRYDDTSSWGAEDEETDEAEFQELRKRLKVLQQIVAAIDEQLYLQTIGNVVDSIFARLGTEGSKLNWRELDLAMYEMYQLGELAIRNGGLYQKRAPSSAASDRAIQVMSTMIESDCALYPHPSIHLQYMEMCVRHCGFFDTRTQSIPKVLENFVRFVHSEHIKVRSRSWHLFLRLVRHLRSHLGNIAETVVRAIEDLLVIKAEVTEESNDDDMSSNQNSQSADTLFNSQLHLFEAIGCIASASSVSGDTQVMLARSIISPLSSGIEQHLGLAIGGDEKAILQIHHCIMALGTLAHGFSDWTSGTSGTPVSNSVSEEFLTGSNVILVALGSLKSLMFVRTAARSAFSRMIGVLGSRVLQQLPQWLEGLVAETSTKDEMASFLRLLDQVIFGFKTQIFDILDALLTPLLQRIFTGFSEQSTGTDDEIQLGELRREYLNFLLILLGNDLESVLISTSNQSIFETIINTIEHFARETGEHPDAKLALSVFTKMSSVWGGPDILNPTTNPTPPSPTLPGFDRFMLTKFSSLTWSLMTSATFDPKDPQANRVIGEIATLQQTILAKTGREYLSWLSDAELMQVGLQGAAADAYMNALVNSDAKGFKTFLINFLKRGRG